MTQQPDMKYTWNTMVASSFWDMRLSVACTATDAEFQNRIIIRDHTMNLHVVARQPHPGPGAGLNQAPHTAPRPPVAGVPNRTTARSQLPQVAWEPVSSLTRRHLNSPMLSGSFICQHDLRTQLLVAHPPLNL